MLPLQVIQIDKIDNSELKEPEKKNQQINTSKTRNIRTKATNCKILSKQRARK